MNMRKSPTLALGLLASVALLAAGCGGKQQAASTGSGAQFVRADALAFVSVDTDFGSSQWKQLDALANKFPGRDQAVKSIEKSIAGQGLDFSADIKPALGPELDLAVASGATLKNTAEVGLLQPGDEGKFKALVAKQNQAQPNSKSVYRKLDNGWYAIADSQAAIDQVLKGSNPALSDESLYKDALAKQPSDALAKAYVNGQELGKLVQKTIQAHGSGLSGSTTSSLQNLDFVSASLSAENDGVRLQGATQGSGSSVLGGGDYTPKLLGEAPSDAFAFLSFKGGQSLGSGLGSLTVPLETALGIPLKDLLALFENENAAYVRPGAVIPEFAAILQPSDTTKGMATLTKLAERAAAGGAATLSGGAEKTLSVGTQFQLHFGIKDGKIVITNAPGGIGQVGASGQSLADSADFKEAKDAAGLPDANGGFFYFDLKNTIPLIEGFAGLAGTKIPPQVSANLAPLRSFLEWSAGSGNSRTFDAFLEIK
ncbi:MAG: DUF3352 domain-containing protein [Gaiellaceae bacterium]